MGLVWWKGATLTFTGIAVFGWSVHFWNEGYRKRGEIHPITAFLEQFMSIEEEDRKKRIQVLEDELLASDRRLYAIHRWFPMFRSKEHTVNLDKNKIILSPDGGESLQKEHSI